MKRIIGLLVAVSVMVFSGSAMAATIVDGPHDMTAAQQGFSAAIAANTGSQANEVCIYCHTPHNASKKLQLWNRASSTSTFSMYSSYSMDMIQATLDADSISRECLSCHDGTTAIDAIIKGDVVDNSTVITAGAAGNFGTDLSDDHPIGITYDTTAAGDTAFNTVVDARGDGVEFFGALGSETVECPSCHNVHGDSSAGSSTTKFLRTSNYGSALCLACHIK